MTGVIGFSLGGALALLADRHPSVAVISANYSIVPPNAWAVRPVPVVASFGGDDRLLPRGGGRLRRMARASGIAHDILTYGGAGHSFMTGIGPLQEQSRSGRLIGAKNHPVASADAWERTLRFFDRHLSSVATRCDSDGLAASAG
jgi:carboxymethylenebutenolidase